VLASLYTIGLFWLKLKEADINLNIGDSGAFIIPHPKEKKPKKKYFIK
jgi:hypothetical protein